MKKPSSDGFVLRDPDGVKHASATDNAIKTTWCEVVDFQGEGMYWHSDELTLERGVPTCMKCVAR